MELLISLLLGLGVLGYAASEADDAEEEYNDFLNNLKDQQTSPTNGTNGNDNVTLTNEADTFDAGPGHDVVNARAGFDTVSGGTGDDILIGDFGKDLLQGNGGEDTLLGGDWHDGLFGGTQDDELYGGGGNDILQGGAGDDFLDGGTQPDLVMGASGSDVLLGGGGSDLLEGGGVFNRELNPDDYELLRNLAEGEDLVFPNFRITKDDDGDPDILDGGDNNDALVLGSGDTGTGGAGSDDFVVGDWITAGDPAIITDYESSREVIHVLVENPVTAPTPMAVPGDGPGHVRLTLDGNVIANIYGDFGVNFVGTIHVGGYNDFFTI